jgi:hypothetical protein
VSGAGLGWLAVALGPLRHSAPSLFFSFLISKLISNAFLGILKAF